MAFSEDSSYPNRGTAWWLIAVLICASILSMLDRSILNFVVDPMRSDLGLSDVQIGLLQGLAFGIFYASVGLPLGLSADRYRRRTLIICGISLWSLATVAAGFAQSFGSLFLARILVGLGEAALSPAAISLIADVFPPAARGFPISLYFAGQAVSNGLAISITSFVLAAAAAGDFSAVPVLQSLAPWRVAFVCCGLAGTPVIAMLLTTYEPARRRIAATPTFARQAWSSLVYFGANYRVFGPLYLGFALCFMAIYGAGAWAPTMLMRVFTAKPTEIGAWLGPLTMLFALVGTVAGGLLIDYQFRRGRPMARFTILVAAPLCIVPSALAVFAPKLLVAIVLVASGSAFSAVIGTTMFALLQSTVPPEMHGFSVALTGLLNTVIGATFGPLLISALTEHLYRNPASVGYSISTVVVPALLSGSLLFALAAATVRRQKTRATPASANLSV